MMVIGGEIGEMMMNDDKIQMARTSGLGRVFSS